MEVIKSKRERSTAKGMFTKACNRLIGAIQDESEVDLIDARFESLKIRWSDLQVKHDKYMMSAFPEGDEEEVDIKWLDEEEEKFESTEKMKFEYVRKKRKMQEMESEESKHNVETRLRQESFGAEAGKNKGIRNMHSNIYKQEVKCLEELMLTDSDGILKTQIMEALKDVKLQLERCRESHVKYLESMETGSDDKEHTSWIEDLYRIRSDISQKVANHFKILEAKKDSIIQVEKMKLPVFNGEMRHYAKFKSDFEKYVMPSIKLKESSAYVLRSCLSENVKDIIINVEDKIDKIWKRLDEKYGDISKLADMIVNDVRKIRPIREGDNKGFISLVDTIEKGYRDLALLSFEKEISNTGTVSLVEEKLPRDIMREWSKEVNRDGSCVDVRDKFPALLKFLCEQRKIIEYEFSDLRCNATDNYNRQRVHHMYEGGGNGNLRNTKFDQVGNNQSNFKRMKFDEKENNNQDEAPKCLVHKNSIKHTTEECTNFKAMDIKTRLQIVRDGRGCWSCLKSGHRSATCDQKKICGCHGCNRYHHCLLHEDSRTGGQVYSLDYRFPNNETRNNQFLPSEDILQTKEPVLSIDSKSTQGSDLCLLPLMNIPCKGKNLNVLWDTGASISLVTNEVAKELSLCKGTKRFLTLILVGGSIEEIQSNLYTVPLLYERN